MSGELPIKLEIEAFAPDQQRALMSQYRGGQIDNDIECVTKGIGRINTDESMHSIKSEVWFNMYFF